MDLLELGRCESGRGIALIVPDLIEEPELFQEPNNPL